MLSGQTYWQQVQGNDCVGERAGEPGGRGKVLTCQPA